MSNPLTHEVHGVQVVDFLNRLKGRSATLLLQNGSQITGKIPENVDYATAFTTMVHLTRLEGQELFEALIPKNTIVGFIFRP